VFALHTGDPTRASEPMTRRHDPRATAGHKGPALRVTRSRHVHGVDVEAVVLAFEQGLAIPDRYLAGNRETRSTRERLSDMERLREIPLWARF
jgi:hypothetical protein